MSGFLCSMVGASFTVAAAAEVLRSKKGITAVGNAQVDTAQSKFGGASVLFDGTGDYLEVANNFSWHNQSTGTIEFFFRLNSTAPFAQGLFSQCIQGADTGLQLLLVNNRLYLYKSATTSYEAYNVNITTGQFYHIAIVKESSTTVKFYVDGTLRHTDSAANGYTDSAANFFLGRGFGLSSGSWDGTRYDQNGWIDEFRISNSARYTAAFTPSTTAFVNDANTVLLIHANGTDASTFFEDDNGVRAPIGITGVNQAQISTAQSKFGASSIVFDGADDYLTLATFPTTTGDLTYELWGRFDILPWNQTYAGGSWMQIAFDGSSDYLIISRSGGSGSQVNLQVATGNRYGAFTKSGVNLAINTWYHIAFVRSSGVWKAFFNGTELTTFTNESNFTNSSRTENVKYGQIGKFSDGRGSWDGYMDEIRFSNSARYTADYTPPTAPFVNDANTLLLIHADGTNASTVFRDDNGAVPFSTRTAKTFTVFNQAQIDTAQFKYGSSSYLGDGTGDYLVSSATSDLQFTGNFTVELWIRLASTGAIRVPIGNRSSGTGLGIWWVEIGTDQTGYSAWQNTAGTNYYPSMSGTISTNTWYHIAIVRNGSTLTMYKDGVGGTAATSVTGTFGATTAGIIVGGIAASYNWNGHIDEVRISNVARYTANFTAPTGPFNSDSNTVLLMHMEGTDASTTFTDDEFGVRTQKGIQALGNAQISTAQSKFGGTSALFDGTGDALSTDGIAFGTTAFTVEYWIRPTALSGYDIHWDLRGTPTSNLSPIVYTNGTTLYVDVGATTVITGSTLSTNTWYHIALARSGSSTKLFVDGTQVGSTYTDSNNYVSAATLYIGELYSLGGNGVVGNMDEFRISNSARYTTTFTPSTAPFQNDANTLLLIHADGTNASTVFTDDNGVSPTHSYT